MGKILGKEYPLSKIFSSDFDYYIPPYQRPYAWTEEEAGTLFDDLYDFYQTEKEDSYFLGSIVLIKEEEKARAEVIDGQQRLTTLSIFLASIISRFPEDLKTNGMKYICEPGNPFEGLESQPRLHIRDRDRSFFEKYIQGIKFDELFKLDPEQLDTEAQQHILLNAKMLNAKLDEKFTTVDELQSFCRFLVTRCYLVAVSTENQQSAFRVFSVMNSRGLDLLPIDIIKSNTIGSIAENERQAYTDKWEAMENLVSRAGFNDVFTHTRMIFAMRKGKKSLLEEFNKYVLTEYSGKALIDSILEPYTDAYAIIKKAAYQAVEYSGEVNNILQWLNRIDNSDWVPVAMRFFAEHQQEPAYCKWFVEKLERLASYMHVTSRDVNARIDRYHWILEEMENNKTSEANPLKTIELTNVEKKAFMEALDGEVYRMTSRRRNYIILRLDSFVSDGAAKYDSAILTIEHVLPQTVKDGSEWSTIWTDVEQRQYWLNRVANLVPLTRKHNSEAQNYDFDIKKNTYFKGKNGTTSYSLTTQVIDVDEWTPDVVIARQKALLDVFEKKWDLSFSKDDSLSDTFRLTLRGCNAEAVKTEDGGLNVIAGSMMAMDVTDSLQQTYLDLRQTLIDDGIVDEKGVFLQDYKFSSPSAAACVISGRSANGNTEWMTVDGVKLKDTK